MKSWKFIAHIDLSGLSWCESDMDEIEIFKLIGWQTGLFQRRLSSPMSGAPG